MNSIIGKTPIYFNSGRIVYYNKANFTYENARMFECARILMEVWGVNASRTWVSPDNANDVMRMAQRRGIGVFRGDYALIWVMPANDSLTRFNMRVDSKLPF